MQTMESRWTDDRMDDLNSKVEKIDREMRTEFRAQRTEMQSEFRAVRSEIKMLQVTMIGGFVSILAAIAGLFVTQL